MAWVLATEEDATILKEIEGTSDRAAAIVAASYLEERLTETLRTTLEPDEDVASRMFKGYGPLATFSAKIELAYLMAIISPTTRRELLIIKDIRNEYAHRPYERTFESQRIRDLCGNLTERYSKGQYWLSLDELKGMLDPESHVEGLKRLKQGIYAGPDTPKSRFLAAVQECLAHLTLMKQMITLARLLPDLELGDKFWPWSSPRKLTQQAPQVRRTARQPQKKPKRQRRSSPE